MQRPPKLALAGVLTVIVIGVLVALDSAAPKQKKCELVDGDRGAYTTFMDAQGDNELNLKFEITTIIGAIDGQTTRSIYTCPTTLDDVSNAKSGVILGDRQYYFDYERLNDYQYKLKVGVEGEKVEVTR